MSYRALATSICLALLASVAPACFSAEAKSAKTDTSQYDSTAPVLVEADHFNYDSETGVVSAEGHAQVIQNKYLVLAERITYNQNNGEVKAVGAVSVTDPTGNSFFADEAVLQDGIRTGVIQNFRSRLADNSVFAAREARKLSESVTEMDHAAYTACKVCDEKGNKKTPFWQVRAREVTVDQEDQRVFYHNAWMDLFGMPVFYTPYFSHPTPNADRKSGFLMPSYQLSEQLGARLDLPYYVNIAPEMDAVITPIFTTKEGIVMSGQYRHLLDSGMYQLGGSITRVDRHDKDGNQIPGEEWRGHIQGSGDFQINDFWHWGFNGKYVSDDTYLRIYGLGYEDTLTSKIYAEGYEGRTYMNVEAVGFQGLRATDIASEIPTAVPLIDASHETKAGWHGSRFGVTGNAVALTREVGAKSRRLSSSAYWRLPHIMANGQVVEIKPQMRADFYSISDQPITNTVNGTTMNGQYNGSKGRAIPELAMTWRLPLLKRMRSSSVVIEPIVKAVIGANGLNDNRIPNEDSLGLEFSDANLFSENHFPGYDLVETGTRVNYGIRGQWDYDGEGNIAFLFGQNYHTDKESLFPYSNNLNQSWSDYVGYVGWNYADFGQLNYRFRLDRNTGDLNRSEIESVIVLDPVTLQASYVKLAQNAYNEESEEIRGSGSLQLTEQWAWTAIARRDLTDEGGMLQSGTGLVFQNECVTVNTSFNRYYIQDRDVEPSSAIKLEVFLANLN